MPSARSANVSSGTLAEGPGIGIVVPSANRASGLPGFGRRIPESGCPALDTGIAVGILVTGLAMRLPLAVVLLLIFDILHLGYPGFTLRGFQQLKPDKTGRNNALPPKRAVDMQPLTSAFRTRPSGFGLQNSGYTPGAQDVLSRLKESAERAVLRLKWHLSWGDIAKKSACCQRSASSKPRALASRL